MTSDNASTPRIGIMESTTAIANMMIPSTTHRPGFFMNIRQPPVNQTMPRLTSTVFASIVLSLLT